jgi:hypothetical protein
MITLLQANAILSILMAFGVGTTTVDSVRAILIPTATTTQQVAVVQTPVIQNAPVYFGSTAPSNPQPVVQTPTQVQTPVVQSVVMTPPGISSISIDHGVLHVTGYDALNIDATVLPKGVTFGNFVFKDKRALVNRDGTLANDGHGYGVVLNGLPAEYTQIPITLVGTNGGTTTENVVVRIN